MNDDKIRPIGKVQIGNHHKQQMLDYVAQMYDQLALDMPEHPPTFIFFALMNENGAIHTSSINVKPIEDDGDSKSRFMVARVYASLTQELSRWEG